MPNWLSEIYTKNNQYFELECTYFSPSSHKIIKPSSDTLFQKNYVSRSFDIITPTQSHSLKFDLIRNDDDILAKIYLANDLYFEKEIKKTKDREFYLPFPKGSNPLELQDIFCEINFAENKPVEIMGDTHLNIHPHTAYDYNSLTVAGAEELISSYPTMVMLEDGNYKGNLVDLELFLATGDINLGQKYWELTGDFNPDVNYVISPAGHNRFIWMSLNKTNIHYTGGNHNYCIWNNTRNLLRSYFKSESNQAVNIYYHLDAIVAQIGGIIGGLSFSRRLYNKSPLIGDLLREEKVYKKYINSYHSYFISSFLSEFKGYYKSLSIITKFKDLTLKKSFRGKGLYDKEINFIYE